MVGLVASAALLLALAGVTKLRSPASAAAALAAARPHPPHRSADLTAAATAGTPGATEPRRRAAHLVVRALGLTQLAVAAAALTFPLPAAAALIAVTYAALTAFAWRLRHVAPDTDCGCFGASDPAPATGTHVAANAAIAITAALTTAATTATANGRSVVAFVADNPAAGALLTALAAVLAGLFVQLMTALPALAALRSTSREAA